MLKLMQDVNTMSLDKFQADELATRAQYERSDAILGGMGCVRRVVSMEPQVIVVAGSNDHLQSRGLLSRLTDGSIPSNEVIGEAIMTLLSAMAEVETAAKQRFTQIVVKVVFVLSPGYAALPEPLQFVNTMVTTIAEGRFNLIIPAPNRVIDPNNYYPSRSELPAIWADISNAIQGLKDCSTTRLVLDEVLGLELSNFARLLKLRPGVDDDHLLVQQVADNLWFRQMDHVENDQGRTVRKNMTSAEEDLMAMALRTKPHNNLWLYLSPRLFTLGEDAFEHAPAVIKEIHVYLKNLFDARELAGGMMLKLMQDVNTMSLDKFQADVLATRAQYEQSDAILGGMGCVRRVVSMEPQVIVVAGSNDHLQSRGLLCRLTDGSIPSNEVIGEAIMTLLSAMAEVETAAKQRFTQNIVKVVFLLSPGYAALPEPLQFVNTMVTTIAEGRFNVIIPAPNRVIDPNNYYPSRSELPAVWADISNAIQGLKDCSTTRLVLDEVLGLELSNFARLLKLRPGVDDNHLLVQQVADDLWFRQMDHAENEQGRTVRKNMTSAEEDLMAMALRTKPHNNLWLYLSPRLCTLGEDAFEHAPAVIKEIHVYLKNLFDARELAGGMMLKLMQDENTMSLDKFQADVLATRAQYD